MKTIHVSNVPEEEQRSPTGKFRSFARNVSIALGGKRNVGLWGGGHPFDLQIRRIPQGCSICPFHAHIGQWELFFVQSGEATVRAGDVTIPASAGDVFVHPPGEPHQLINRGTTDLVVLIVADNPAMDACHYPDSDKWTVRPLGNYFRMQPTTYFDGEEDPIPNGPADQPTPPKFISPVPLTPFLERKRATAELPWVPWTSPKGKFRGTSKELSLALGAKHRTPPGMGGHPFDLELSKLAPGETGCPLHSHAAQWEMFFFLEGRCTVRTPQYSFEAGPGDVVLQAPGDAHQLRAIGPGDTTFFLIADNPLVDIWHYPDSDKWGFTSPRKFFRAAECDYFDGEE